MGINKGRPRTLGVGSSYGHVVRAAMEAYGLDVHSDPIREEVMAKVPTPPQFVLLDLTVRTRSNFGSRRGNWGERRSALHVFHQRRLFPA